MWRVNSKAWVTGQFFTEWMHEVFAPGVKKYLVEKKLPVKAILIMDNAPAHVSCLENAVVGKNSFIQVKFLPPNTTPLI